MAGIRIEGNTSGNVVEVTGSNQLKIIPETDASSNPNNVGSIRFFSENDAGVLTNTPYLYSPETDEDYRMRTSLDNHLDHEIFNYAAQNTGKHTYATTALTMTWTAAGLTTNGGAVTTTNVGATFSTYAEFPLLEATSLFAEFEVAFSAQPTSNVIIDFGLFRRGGANQYAPTDGVYFRLNSSGLNGVINYNGTETIQSINKTYTSNEKLQFIITFTHRSVQFWINNQLGAEIPVPAGQSLPVLSTTLPLSIRHGHTGVAGSALRAIFGAYSVTIGGPTFARTLGEIGNAMYGSYQGLSGGTMGQLVAGTVTTGTLVKPTAAIPSNTALTANLPNNLAGRAWEQLTAGLAVNTDGILAIYQNPAGTIAVQGKRLKITGVKMSATIQTVIVGGPVNNEFCIIFGGTAASLQTAEGIAAKPCRRVFIPEFTQTITAAQAVNTPVAQCAYYSDFSSAPIYVNPGEFIGLAVNRFGTALTSGVIAYTYQFIYSWE